MGKTAALSGPREKVEFSRKLVGETLLAKAQRKVSLEARRVRLPGAMFVPLRMAMRKALHWMRGEGGARWVEADERLLV